MSKFRKALWFTAAIMLATFMLSACGDEQQSASPPSPSPTPAEPPDDPVIPILTPEPYRNRRKRFGLRLNLICGIVNHERGLSFVW